ncbi:glucokinase [Shimia biformata]|uniref:glucokinase n=1 Tax=Shimia biformata TaxID=1294299 RepID=UPI00195065B6|nr:glucokinase [Shimia biformata]
MYLLADIGGTNCRMALADESGLLPASQRSFANDDFATFYDLLAAFLASHDAPTVTSACIAIAGPVTGRTARVTNRAWEICSDALERDHRLGRVQLINDLSALGYASAALPATGFQRLRDGGAASSGNGQSLVLGVGTGLNICPVRDLGTGLPSVAQSEMGHAGIPAPSLTYLTDAIGAKAPDFPSNEQCLSGLGLAALYAARCGGTLQGHQIMAAANDGSDPDAAATIDLAAALLGVLVKELTYQFMPLNGIYLAGSVARSLCDETHLPKVLAAHDGVKRRLDDSLPAVPLSLITDDAAALVGCLAVARSL